MMLESAIKPANYKGPQVEFITRNINEGNEESHEKIRKAILRGDNTSIGKLVNEPGIGVIPEEWNKILGSIQGNVEDVLDCSILMDEILAVKEPEELENIKIASKYACFIMENLNRRFENIIDEDKKVPHSTIANEIKGLTEKPQFQNKFKEKSKLQNNIELPNLEISSHPIIQSGGNYSLSPLSPNDNNNLSSDVIICKVNSRYKDYNSNIIRTFMIDSDKTQQNYYKILYEAFNHLISQMQEGVLISQLYEKVFDFIISKDASLKDHIPDNFGNGIGLENLNQSLIINRSNYRKLAPGMSFNIIMSFINLRSEKGLKYCLQIADTLVFKSNSVKDILTNDFSKVLSDIYYNMEDEEEEQEKNKKQESRVHVDNSRKTRRHNTEILDKNKENQRRKEHQLELLQKKNEEFKERILNDGNMNEEVQVSKKNLTTIKSYSSKSQLPPEIKPGKIFVDSRNDTLILPIFRMMVPFHISLIKNVSKNEENSFSNLRINFHTPITGVPSTAFGDMNIPQPVYIRDLSYKSADQKNMANLFKQIKDLIKKVKVKDQEEKEKSDLVAQESLVLMKGKRIYLNDVIVRPNITSKKTSGVLEAHQNGFRFQSNKGEKIDIIYKNIKHAFLQPGENELIVVLHFHLKNPILVGKKKTFDVQFYREAGSQADDLDLRRRGNDYEEYEIELKERMMKEKINDEFTRFTKQVEELKEIEFDVPARDLAFTGVPFKSNVTLIPTAFCLVSLIEMPFFVITLDEVELVYFERVSHSIKNFDMAIIFKDLNKPVLRIGTIPMENLEMIKSWIDDCDILFSEGLYNMNWNKIIDKIKKDPEAFIEEDGGWASLVDNVIFIFLIS